MKLAPDALDRITAAFEGADFGDPRRSDRLARTVRKLAEAPNVSIPKAMGSDADLEAAYRLLHNPHVDFDTLIRAYAEATAARASGCVLAIHDTTTCEFNHADAKDVGYLNTGRAGFMAHYSLIVDGELSRRPLGVANAEVISRENPPSRPGTKKRNQGGPQTAKKRDRESLRWFRGFQVTSARLKGCEVIHVADRESDSYEIFARCLEAKMRFVLRSRVGARKARGPDGEVADVMTLAQACEGKVTREVPLSPRAKRREPRANKANPPRVGRNAQLRFSATNIEIRRPHYVDKSLPSSLRLNMVVVSEVDPPADQPAVNWVLFTTETIATADDITRVVDIYRARWLIEECNKTLKSVCKYEERQLESRDALLTLLAMTFPIACEVLWLRAACRANPKRPASEVITPVQLQILAAMSSYKLPSSPTVHDAVWAIAALGGHIKSNGEPGVLVLHRGMADLLAFEKGWRAREMAAGLSISR